MLSRRSFALSFGAIYGVGNSATASDSLLGVCERSCFNSDYPALGYDKSFWWVFDLGAQHSLRAVASGRVIRPEIASLFYQDRLYLPVEDSVAVEWRRSLAGFELLRLRFDLECGVPVIGCLGIPDSAPRGLVLLAHGIGSVPERCFTDDQPDYMKGIGKRLCALGFAVWCPYIFQAGNQASQNDMAAMLNASAGISLHNVSCSCLDAGKFLFAKLGGADVRVGCYGVSWGALLALHLEAATGAGRPTVASGYLRDDRQLLSSVAFLKRNPFEVATYIHFERNRYKFAGGDLASALGPTPLYLEIGIEDPWNSNEYGRNRVFDEMKSAYAGGDIKLEIFDGPHEAHGGQSLTWLSSRLKA